MKQLLILTSPEKVIFEHTKKFHIQYCKCSELEAEKEAIQKIYNIREMNAEISNPKSKSYFPY
jgi:hypothetical protein